jgi:hypothetical protein
MVYQDHEDKKNSSEFFAVPKVRQDLRRRGFHQYSLRKE